MNPLFTLLTYPLATWLFVRFTRWEVARNLADILADGAKDSLRRAYHLRRTLVRAAVLAALALLAAAPLLLAGRWLPAALVAASAGALLAGFFARYFSCWLNEARGLPYWRASGDSASWPDASAFQLARAAYPNPLELELAYVERQLYADAMLCRLVTRTWRVCYWLAAGLAGAALLCYLR